MNFKDPSWPDPCCPVGRYYIQTGKHLITLISYGLVSSISRDQRFWRGRLSLLIKANTCCQSVSLFVSISQNDLNIEGLLIGRSSWNRDCCRTNNLACLDRDWRSSLKNFRNFVKIVLGHTTHSVDEQLHQLRQQNWMQTMNPSHVAHFLLTPFTAYQPSRFNKV